MVEPQEGGATTQSFAVALQAPSAVEVSYFLIVERASSRTVALPSAGFLLIGRTAEADIQLDDPSVSRRHAKVLLQDGAARVMDLDSRNGVRVNGVPIEGARDIAPGDVVSIGDVALILRSRARSKRARALLSAEELAARLAQEIERALEYARPLSVAIIAAGACRDEAAGGSRCLGAPPPPPADAALDHALRTIDVAGRTRDRDLVVILPELGADEARAAVALVIEHIAARSPGARAGIASCPADGCDAGTLLAAARDACRAMGPGGIAGDGDRVRTLTMGDRTVILADPAMSRIFSLIERLAAAELPVLVVGETGAGKEHAAYAVHHGSARRVGPFVSVNCAAIPDTLVESELFGHDKGAFSGAHAARPGLFERAHGGTLFLDEIGELSLAAQAKLLRVLEGGRFTRLGEGRERAADVRIVAATNRDLAAEVKARRFREDLFYRLSSAVVLIPPLRERPADIPVLARRFLLAARERAGKGPLAIAPAAMLALAQHRWPGNVRELRNAMEYAASVAEGVVERSNLPAAIAPAAAEAPDEGAAGGGHGGPGEAPCTAHFRPIAEELEGLERRRMREALAAAGGVKKEAARLISMPERTFRLKLRQYGLGEAAPMNDGEPLST